MEHGHCLGSVCLATHQEDFWPKDCWHKPGELALGIFGLCVHPSEQRKGIGTLLMLESAKLASAHNLDWLRLDTYERNLMSNAFYQKLGYSQRAVVDLNGNALAIYEVGTASAIE